MKKWYENIYEEGHGVIISSRIRLARNLNNYPFPNHSTSQIANSVIENVKKAIVNINKEVEVITSSLNMNAIRPIDKMAMMEKHIISPLFVRLKRPTYLILSEDESVSIMINEEDHIRIQVMTSGMNLDKVLTMANKIDDSIEEELVYAFDQELGYLTACPTNLGTGLRASYMIHVPALETTGQLQLILEAIRKFGLAVRGIYGEGTEALGSVLQISNQITLGKREEEIIENLTSVTKQIVEQELIARNKLIKEQRAYFEDIVYRAYGLLNYARQIQSREAMTLLSDIKLGMELGVIKTKKDQKINIYALMTEIQSANLQIRYNRKLDKNNLNKVRADYIRKHLPEIIGG